MTTYSDYHEALTSMKYWAGVVMDDAKPNSDRYDNARRDRDWADTKLREYSRLKAVRA